jgi:hypothetical protein
MLSKLIASTLAISTLVCAQSARAESPVTVAPVVSQPARAPRFRTPAIALLTTGSILTAGGVVTFVVGGTQGTGDYRPGGASGPAVVTMCYFAGGLALGLGVGALITGAVLYARGNEPERQSTPVAFRSFGMAPSADGVAASALFTF